MTDTCDVAIIGLGPIGATLGNLLGMLGVSTILMDREETTYHLPRAVAYDDEIMRLFQIMGLADDMQAISEVGSGALFVDNDNNTLVQWDRPMHPTANGWCPNYRFHQPDLEKVLRNALDRYPAVEQRWSCNVTGLDQDADGVTLTYDYAGTTKTLRSAYVVGCDGGRSFTRGQIDAGLLDLGFHEQWLIADLLLPEPETDPDRHTYHYCGTPRMGSKVFVGSGRKRWEFRLNADDDPETICDPASVWGILAPWITPAEAELERAAIYTFHSMIADSWQQDRIFIAGDAAHQTPPFMGQGMCAGLRDAANLAWKLHAILHQFAPAELLASYHSERIEHVRAYIELTINLGQLINATMRSVTTGGAAAPEDGPQKLSQLKPALGPGVSAGTMALVDALFPQIDADLDLRVGYRPALICDADLPPDLMARCRASGIVPETRPDSDLRNWLQKAGYGAVLVRPDRIIMGAVAHVDDAARLLPDAWRYANV